jgi:hypothetical protein
VAAFEGGLVFISKYKKPDIAPFIAYSGDHFKRCVALSRRGRSGESGPSSSTAPFKIRKLWCRAPQWVSAAPAVLAPAIRQARDPAVLPAVAVRRDPAAAAAPRAVDFPSGFPAVAPTVFRAGSADPPADRSAFCCLRHFTLVGQRRAAGNVPDAWNVTVMRRKFSRGWIMPKAPGIRHAGSAPPPHRRADHASEWRCGAMTARRSRHSL